MEIKNADLWWPRGYGEPALYDAKVELVDSDGTILSTDNKRVGLRTIQLDITDINLPPDHPGKFCFIVNGEPIFIHGTNWVPMDALHSRDHSFVDESIRMAVELNCNMIRCWGGNVYEDHHFFNLCDENGIMAGFYDGMHFLSSTQLIYTSIGRRGHFRCMQVTQSSITRFMVRK